jgi:2-methylcitrate dehydratase
MRLAHLALMDFLGCAIAARNDPHCRRIIKPLVSGMVVPGGARVPGTGYELDPSSAAFGFGTLGRWLDYNDSWFGKFAGGHPSDMFGAIVALGDFLSRNDAYRRPLTMRDMLVSGIKAYEILGLHIEEDAYGGYDYTAPLKVACAATLTRMLGGGVDQVVAAMSQAWVDGQPLRIVRTPRTGPRKSWASPDAAARAVWLAIKTMDGESGYPDVLTTPVTGVYEADRNGEPLVISREFGSHVMDTIQFKTYPAQFRTQTAVEAAVALHPKLTERFDEIASIDIETHERTIKTVDKRGQLHGPADRDHCLQYIVAIALIFGTLRYRHYEDDVAADPRIDILREKMIVCENSAFTMGYNEGQPRMDANAITVTFKDGSNTDRVEVLYPMGDPIRRSEVASVLSAKFEENISDDLPPEHVDALMKLYENFETFVETPVGEFVNLTVLPEPAA